MTKYMSENKKIIKINPSLFNVKKTQKQREKKQKPSSPIINPNVLKTRLINRIKEHKLKGQIQPQTTPLQKNKEKSFSDDFNESIDYLNSLALKTQQDKQIFMQKQQLQNVSPIKSRIIASVIDDISLNLPDSLQNMEPTFSTKHIPPPYSNLKGGTKPSYREWSKTQKNHNHNQQNKYDTIQENIAITKIINPEKNQEPIVFSQHLKNSFTLPAPLISSVSHAPLISSVSHAPLISSVSHAPLISSVSPAPLISSVSPAPLMSSVSPAPLMSSVSPAPLMSSVSPAPLILQSNTSLIQSSPILNSNYTSNSNTTDDINPIEKITKKTIKRRYVLGKNKTQNKVGILIKNRDTRKKIIKAQEDLKNTNMHDIKNYLKKKGLIKIGSTAPNNILRKIYENTMLAGDVYNKNTETLLNNFLKDKDFDI
jgi:hypothetical protein